MGKVHECAIHIQLLTSHDIAYNEKKTGIFKCFLLLKGDVHFSSNFLPEIILFSWFSWGCPAWNIMERPLLVRCNWLHTSWCPRSYKNGATVMSVFEQYRQIPWFVWVKEGGSPFRSIWDDKDLDILQIFQDWKITHAAPRQAPPAPRSQAQTTHKYSYICTQCCCCCCCCCCSQSNILRKKTKTINNITYTWLFQINMLVEHVT